MTSTSKQQLRRLWFQIHKWLGLSLALLIIPISLTGAALVWHDALDQLLNPERQTTERAALQPSAYAASAVSHAGPGDKLLSLQFPSAAGAVVATLFQPAIPAGGRPVRTLLHLDPVNARLLDRSASNEGLVHIMHVLHGSLMVPGAGRQIVGWIGVAMLISSLTGLWLWWPLKGSFRRGLRWQRQPTTSANLHHQSGFWIALPLAVVSATGVWISFPPLFAQLSGDPAGPSPAERARRIAAAPVGHTRLTADEALARAAPHSTGAVTQLAWPTEGEGTWKISFAHAGVPAEVAVSDSTGAATPPKPPRPETTARLMRRIHDGTGMGVVWQVVIFIGGILPAVLAVTGILMWLNIRRRKSDMTRRRRSRAGGAELDASPVTP